MVHVGKHTIHGSYGLGSLLHSLTLPKITGSQATMHKRAVTNLTPGYLQQIGPITSMYGIFTYIYHKFMPNVGKSSIHDGMGYRGLYLYYPVR